mmetsp:Transcript_9309/g.15147  ORF Transcript_9309/g.15147 Transcript_9309/m.15147 type:complete len:507 (+) Transcript_9309:522-2042(+)
MERQDHSLDDVHDDANPFRSRMTPPAPGHNRAKSPNLSQYSFDVDAFEAVLREKGVLKEIQQTFNLIAIPLLIMAVIGVGFILVWAKEILVPFVIALFFTFLLKPFVDLLSQPFGSCADAKCFHFFNAAACRRRTEDPVRKDSSSDVHLSFEQDDDGVAKGEVELSSLIDKSDELRSRGAGKAATPKSRTPSSRKYSNTGVCFRCRHAKCPRWLSILVCMVLVFGFFTGVVVLIVDAIQTFEDEDLDQFEEKTVEMATSIKNWIQKVFNIDSSSMLQQFRNEFHLMTLTKSLILGGLNGLEYVFIVFLFVLYMLFEDPDAADAAGVNNSHSHARDLRRQIDMQIQRYLVIKTLISLLVGFAVFIVLGPILHVKMAHIYGVITFFANFIPNFGAMIATMIPFPMVVLDPHQTTISMILAFALPTFIHSIVGNVIEPKVFGDTMELHPVVVLISLSFWYTVWGIAGAILSVPITAVLRIVVSHIKHPYARVILCLLEGKLPGSRAFHA